MHNQSESKPKLQDRIVTLEKDNKILFLDPDKPDWVVTNQNGARAIALCDGKLTINDVAQKISESAEKDLTKEIVSFLKNIQDNHSIFLKKLQPGTFVHKLRIAQISLTQHCNLKCIYCYASPRVDASEKSCLSLKEYKKVIDDINDIGNDVGVLITGGEPLLSRNCIEVGKYAAQSGNKPCLLTNGLLITDENAKEIANLFSLIKLSVDGPDEYTHDYHRGKGSFIKVMRAIERLDSLNANISLAMTVTKKNIHKIDEMVARFGKIITFQPLFNAGIAKEVPNLHISGNEYYEALSRVKSVNPLSRLNSRLNNARGNGKFKCAIGDSEISISETGDIFPCHLLHEEKFLAGNIKKSSLKEIYYNSRVLQDIRKIDVRHIDECKSCPVRLICGGACRARAYHERGRIDVSGDFCEYEAQAIINGIFDTHEV